MAGLPHAVLTCSLTLHFAYLSQQLCASCMSVGLILLVYFNADAWWLISPPLAGVCVLSRRAPTVFLSAAVLACRWVVHWDVATSLEGYYQVRLQI